MDARLVMRWHSAIARNIAGAGASRLVSMAVAVVSVPILLKLLGKEEYGTWVTLTSLLAWVSILDLGVGNSLRNSIARMIDTSHAAEVRQEFVAFFQLLAGIGLLAIFALCGALVYFSPLAENRLTAVILYVPILLLLPLLLSASVLQGARAVGLQSMLQSSVGWLFFLFVAACHSLSAQPDLRVLATAWSAFYVLSLLVMTALALHLLKMPVACLVRRGAARLPTDRLRVGLSFLALQLSSLVLYSLGNAILYNRLGAQEVARYDVVNKIFQVGLGLYTVVIGVMWSEISRLRALAQFPALRSLYRKMMVVALAFSGCIFLVAFAAPWVIGYWTAHRIEVRQSEALTIAALVSLQAVAYVGAVFLNAFEQIRIQIVLACFSIVLMVPIANALLAAGHGIAAVPLAAAALTLLPAVLCNTKAMALLHTDSRTAVPPVDGS